MCSFLPIFHSAFSLKHEVKCTCLVFSCNILSLFNCYQLNEGFYGKKLRLCSSPQVLLRVINLQKLSALNLFGLAEFFAFNIFLNCQAQAPNPKAPNPKPRGLGLTLKSHGPPPHPNPPPTFKHEGGIPQ